jgi:hypothetical protein
VKVPARIPARLLAALALLALSADCAKQRPATDVSTPPILLYAVDGLEWNILHPLIEAGRMPVMASLMERGTYGYLETFEPTLSPVIWTTIATGKGFDKHGIRHFVYSVGPDADDKRFYTSGHRETKAFWNILSEYGRTVHCLGWWMTYPVEAINGVMVAQTNTTAALHTDNALLKGTLLRGVEDQVYPAERQNAVMDILDEVDRNMDSVLVDMFGSVPRATTELAKLLWSQSQWAFRADAVYLRVTKDILASGEPFDLLTVYIGGTDVVGHRFWRYTYPEQFWHPPGPEEVESLGRVIPDYYAYIDRALGELIAAAPENATVIVISDHGMHVVNPEAKFVLEDEPRPRNSGGHLNAPPGVFIAAGPNIVRAAKDGLPKPDRAKPVGDAVDVLPTLLALKGIPLGKDFEGNVLHDVIDPDFLARVPVRYVDTHDDKEWDQARRLRMKEAEDRAERLEQLRSLGYIN